MGNLSLIRRYTNTPTVELLQRINETMTVSELILKEKETLEDEILHQIKAVNFLLTTEIKPMHERYPTELKWIRSKIMAESELRCLKWVLSRILYHNIKM